MASCSSAATPAARTFPSRSRASAAVSAHHAAPIGHGFGSHSKWRCQVVLAPHVKKGFALAADGTSAWRMTWSRLLKRTFKIDPERCPACGARVYPENFVAACEPFIIAATLRMLGIFTSAPARAPPRGAPLDVDCDQSRPEVDCDYDQSPAHSD